MIDGYVDGDLMGEDWVVNGGLEMGRVHDASLTEGEKLERERCEGKGGM